MAKVKVFAPNRKFSGVVAGVVFAQGQGQADEAEHASALAYFHRQGYQVGEPEKDDTDEITSEAFKATDADDAPGADDEQDDEVDIPGLPKANASRGDVAEFAEGMGLETEGLTKAQIFDAIKAEAANQ